MTQRRSYFPNLILEFSYNESYFDFGVSHRQTQFKEIRQIRSYDVESLYGDIGGYMGLLLGYSILNLPTMIICCYGLIKKTFLDRRAQKSNNPNDTILDTVFFSNDSRTTRGEITIQTDTSIDKCEGERNKTPNRKMVSTVFDQQITLES